MCFCHASQKTSMPHRTQVFEPRISLINEYYATLAVAKVKQAALFIMVKLETNQSKMLY